MNIIEKLRALIKMQIRREELNFASLGGGGQTMTIGALEWVLKQLDTIGEKSEKPINPVLQDFPTTDEEMEEFLATHPKVEFPEKYKTPDWMFEKPSEGLEEELKDYFRHYYNCDYPKQIEDKTCSVMMIHLVECARHFAQWGAEHLKK